ncbi:MAG: hypothetical protein K8L97_04775 [Anaerolineae bacterium]|nr:hypothetical protein [Anaerolineae bacterium]
MNDDVFLEDDELLDEADAPFWTLPRLIYTVFLVVILIAFLIYTLAPTIQAFLNPLPPPPITLPTDRI